MLSQQATSKIIAKQNKIQYSLKEDSIMHTPYYTNTVSIILFKITKHVNSKNMWNTHKQTNKQTKQSLGSTMTQMFG